MIEKAQVEDVKSDLTSSPMLVSVASCAKWRPANGPGLVRCAAAMIAFTFGRMAGFVGIAKMSRGRML